MSGSPLAESRQLAALLPPLMLAARRVAASVAVGGHGRRRSGPGDGFWQYRGHQPHDPAGAIDWRQSARGARLYVRESEWAAAQTIGLWVDGSASMGWRSAAELPEKRERARVLALALAVLLLRGGERVAVLGTLPPSGNLERLAAALISNHTGDCPMANALPRSGEAVLFSDFLLPLEQIDATVRGMGCAGHLIQILDPAEESLPFSGCVRFSGLEGEGEALIRRAEDVRDAYISRLKAHRDGLAAIAAAAGWSFALHHTDQPPQVPLLALHARLGARR
jgi:uncharacterized protein (DUF58 family)